MSLPEVTEIRRWRLDPGDRLVVLVTGPGISVEVVTP